ncbi:hypothetical protein [uncultured Amnibacterium sp.]|uniref:hypothetical protein n=1 Tax=uncultured Amnibacterium sp. TaxID=1631851 RepID=UPI0035CA8E11
MDAVPGHLLDGDPSVRWQALRDLTDAPAEEVAAERAKVAEEGWGARLLAEQAEDGLWDGGVYRPGWADEERPFFDAWTGTHFVLETLRDLGADPASPAVRRAIDRVREHVLWDKGDRPYFDGETEPCVNGTVLASAAYFGAGGDRVLQALLDRHLADGGWNCWAQGPETPSSFHSTICVLEGLRAWEAAGGADTAVRDARLAGEEYLLERRLLRRRSSGAVIDPRFSMPSFPTRWYYDVLRALEHFRLARPEKDPRCGEAVDLVRGKRLPSGLWNLEQHHMGPVLLDLDEEQEGYPSRWITLRALRVLRWWDGQTPSSVQETAPESSVSTP